MTRVAILNDTHAGARNSSTIFIKYQEEFYSKIFFPYLIENNIKHILHLGDYYEHRKFINFKVLAANRKHFLDKLREYGITMDIIPGNHDVTYRNTNELCSLVELMADYKDVINIHMKPTELQFHPDDLKIAMIPWINDENEAYTLKFLNKTDAPICLGHFEFEGFQMYRGAMSHDGMDLQPFKKFDAVYSGHYHTKSSGGNITYLGAQMEFTWADCDDPKYFHILDLSNGNLESIHNHITLFTKIVYDDKNFDYNNFDYDILNGQFVKVIVTNKTDYKAFDKFIMNIQLRNIYDLKIHDSVEIENFYHNDEEYEIEETHEVISQYIDDLETYLDKDILKKQMNELYQEALHVEDL